MTLLHLLPAASTASVTCVAFSADEPLDPRGRDSLSKFTRHLPFCDIVLCSSGLSGAQTAEGLALEARPSQRCEIAISAARMGDPSQKSRPTGRKLLPIGYKIQVPPRMAANPSSM